VQLPLIVELRRVRGEKRQDFPVIRHWDPVLSPARARVAVRCVKTLA
jgi:hypothetical protein